MLDLTQDEKFEYNRALINNMSAVTTLVAEHQWEYQVFNVSVVDNKIRIEVEITSG